MKHPTTAIMTAALIALPLTAGAVTYSQGANYRDGGVSLRMNVPMGSILNPGQEVAFRYQTLQDAYVIVFNIDSQGFVHVLHPEGDPTMSAARQDYEVPEGRNSSLLVSGETGVEFVFALTVPDRDILDLDELDYLIGLDTDPSAEPYRVDGDPFVAANIVAAELVRGINRRNGIFLDYTYFYVNQRVDHPCYLCGECDRRDTASDCERYQIVASFDRTQPLTYPLRPAYDMVDMGVAIETETPEYSTESGDNRTVVNFYPYAAEVYTYSRPYVYRVYDPYLYDPWYWDPWYAGWCYYPGAWPSYGWGITVGWGWGGAYWGGAYWGGPYWGWGGWCGWNRYYCTPYYYPHQGDGGYYRPERFKSKYKTGITGSGSSMLTAAHRQSITRDSSLRIASKNVRGTTTRVAARTSTATRSSRANATYRTSGTRSVSGAHVSGTSRDRAQTTYKRRTALRDSRSNATLRPTTRTTTRRSTSYLRGTPTRRSTPNGTGVRKSTTPNRSSTGKSSVRSAPRTTNRGKSSVRSAPRTTNRGSSSVRSAPRTSNRSGAARSSGSRGSRSSGSRGGKKR